MKKNAVVKAIEELKRSKRNVETLVHRGYTYKMKKEGQKVSVEEYNDSYELINMYLA